MQLTTKQLVETIGILGVIASLLFVGVQMYYDRQIALGNSYQQRADSRKEDLRTRFESDTFILEVKDRIERGNPPTWWSEDINNYRTNENIPIEELVRYSIRLQLDLYQLDNLIYQRELSLVEDNLVDPIINSWERARGHPLTDGILNMGILRPETYAALEKMWNETASK